MGFKGMMQGSCLAQAQGFSSQIWDLKSFQVSRSPRRTGGFSSQIWDLKAQWCYWAVCRFCVLAAKYGI